MWAIGVQTIQESKTQPYSSVGLQVDGVLVLGDSQTWQPRSKPHPMPMAVACFRSIEEKKKLRFFFGQRGRGQDFHHAALYPTSGLFFVGVCAIDNLSFESCTHDIF